MEDTVLGSGLLVQNPGLLQLGFSMEELGLGLISLCLEMDKLIPGAIELSLSLVQLGFVLFALGLGLLQPVLALLKVSGELLLGGTHGGGDFEELASGLLQGFQLEWRENRQIRSI